MLLNLTNRRRLMIPLIVLIVGGAVAYWASMREARRSQAVREAVYEICRDAAAGKKLSGRLNPDNAFVERQAIAALRRVCTSPDAVQAMQIVVSPGDIAATHAGTTAGQATHTAMLRTANPAQDILGLRIEHRGQGQAIRVLGYWVP